MVKAMDCGIVVSEFELYTQYSLYFRTTTLGKGIKPLSYGLDSIIAVLLEGLLWH